MLHSTPYALAILLPAILVVKFISDYLRNPLRKVPAAHPLAHFTSLWILSVRWRGVENMTLKEAHDRLGPIVCLGPSEVSVNCVKGGIRDVYAGGFEKGNATYNWYGFFANYGGVSNMFSTKHNKPHSARKRMLSNIYSKSVISANESLHAQISTIIFDRFLPGLERTFSVSEQRGVLNILSYLSATTMDVVTGYIFGLKASSNLIDNPDQLERFLGLYNSRRAFNFWPQELPVLTGYLEKWLGYRLTPKWVDAANGEIEDFTMNMCESAEQVLASGGGVHVTDRPVVYRQLQQALLKEAKTTGVVLQPTHLASEVLDHLAAGFETSGITLAYVVHELSLNADIQGRLQHELRTLSPPIRRSSTCTLPDAKAVDALPLLHAILWETLRLHSAIPGPQPRFTPAQGCTLGPEDQSYFVPGGVRVSASAGLLHLNEHVYEHAAQWRPDRWLNMEEKEAAKRKDMESRWFWAFGSGGRMCVGSHLAVYQMKYIIAALYSNYSTVVVDDTGIEQTDAYTAPPKSDRLIIGLRKLEL
ncbi:hypothetical protein ACN47E_003865 [Coniothyrium glycines]